MAIFEVEIGGKTFEIDAPDANAAAAAAKQYQADRPGMASGIARAVAQGGTFGFGDEIEAGIRTLGGFAGDYQKTRDDIRTKVDQFREDHPVAAYGSEIAASAVLPGGVARQAVKAGMGMGKAVAGTSALSGGLYGAGAAETTDDMLPEMAKGAGTGLAVGTVLSKALPAARATAKHIPENAGNISGIGYSVATGDLTGLLMGPGAEIARKWATKEAPEAGSRLAEALRKGTTSASATHSATGPSDADDARERRKRQRLAKALAESNEKAEARESRLLDTLMMGAP
jgi:hypothetical protein